VVVVDLEMVAGVSIIIEAVINIDYLTAIFFKG
jgi:hypothetical protein